MMKVHGKCFALIAHSLKRQTPELYMDDAFETHGEPKRPPFGGSWVFQPQAHNGRLLLIGHLAKQDEL